MIDVWMHENGREIEGRYLLAVWLLLNPQMVDLGVPRFEHAMGYGSAIFCGHFARENDDSPIKM